MEVEGFFETSIYKTALLQDPEENDLNSKNCIQNFVRETFLTLYTVMKKETPYTIGDHGVSMVALVTVYKRADSAWLSSPRKTFTITQIRPQIPQHNSTLGTRMCRRQLVT
jgi:hypothetical protein